MVILGIHDGHNCGASVINDGEIVASVCEERITRKKNDVGYPKLSIENVLEISKINANDLSYVVYASNFMHSPEHLKNIEPWYKVGISDQERDKSITDDYHKKIFDIRKKERIDNVVSHLNINKEKIKFVEHHTAHLAAAYYTNPYYKNNKDFLGFTCDGAGDNLSATVSICKNNTIERISESSRDCSLGKIYSRVTMLMGMTPWEHEFKLMGMAPYADTKRVSSKIDVLRKILGVNKDSLEFELKSELSMNFIYEYLRDEFEGVRFDVIAATVQKFTEELLVEWVTAAIKKTGINNIVCGGGVFMNVKANMLLSNIDSLERIYVVPSSGDESLSFGAPLYSFYNEDKNDSFLGKSNFNNLYLGGDYSLDSEIDAIKNINKNAINIVKTNNIEKSLAKLLSEDKVVARCCGKMEWGARSLGNRSILCSANDFYNIDKINKLVKIRDFWMPFAPSILYERAADYFVDNGKSDARFMAFSYKTHDKYRKDLLAACHPRDYTVRPQLVTKESNASYYNLISEFEKITDRGVLLNTSFNLHGEPIVYTPQDAISVFLRSGIEVLALNNHILIKK